MAGGYTVQASEMMCTAVEYSAELADPRVGTVFLNLFEEAMAGRSVAALEMGSFVEGAFDVGLSRSGLDSVAMDAIAVYLLHLYESGVLAKTIPLGYLRDRACLAMDFGEKSMARAYELCKDLLGWPKRSETGQCIRDKKTPCEKECRQAAKKGIGYATCMLGSSPKDPGCLREDCPDLD